MQPARWRWWDGPAAEHWITRWVFLRLLGVILFIAFSSAGVQMVGLAGENGIVPARRYLEAVRAELGTWGWLRVPTLGWLSASDASIHAMCWAGAGAAVLVVAGVLVPVALLACWILYLSLVHLGQDFMHFQWDSLLLETTFLAIFFAPWQVLPRLQREAPPSRIMLWALRWLLFRLMFFSGVVKLGDPTWTNLDALDYHYETQPLPTVIGWYAHHLPHAVHAFSVAAMFFIEIAVPFFIFCPRAVRLAGAGLLVLLQVLILTTGNYTFFNWLAIALCVLLMDDAAWRRLLRRPAAGNAPENAPALRLRMRTVLHCVVAAPLVLIGVLYLLALFEPTRALAGHGRPLMNAVRPFLLVNHYGLFAHMTTERNEIVLQGSHDEQEWKTYRFRYKPVDPRERPRWVAPHQPRLDWQMWFAALGTADRNPWFINLLARLLEGRPEVLALLAENPFPDGPPRHVRALFYRYQFASMEERRAQGLWYNREARGMYVGSVSLRQSAGGR